MSARQSARRQPDAPPIPPRPPQLLEAVRLANAAREQLIAAIETTDDELLAGDLNEACDELESAIGYMTAMPEIEYLGQYIHRAQS